MKMNPSHEARALLRPAWHHQVISICFWSLLIVASALAFYLVVAYLDEKERVDSLGDQLRRAYAERSACDLMNSLPTHVWVIEAKTTAEASEKLASLAGHADAQRSLLMFAKEVR